MAISFGSQVIANPFCGNYRKRNESCSSRFPHVRLVWFSCSSMDISAQRKYAFAPARFLGARSLLACNLLRVLNLGGIGGEPRASWLVPASARPAFQACLGSRS